MKDFLVFTLVLIISILISSIQDHKQYGFFSRNHTTVLKGFAILTVLWGHIGLAYKIYSIQWIAGIGVSLFLICSGYGLEASFNKNGLTHFWKKRIFAVIIPYWIIYSFANILVEKSFNYKSAFEIIIFVKANWYIPYILVTYVIYWLLKFLVQKMHLSHRVSYLLLFSNCMLWFIIVSYWFIVPSATTLLARQIFAFPLGIVFFDYYKQVESFFTCRSKKYDFLFIIIAVISLAVNMLSNKLAIFTSLPNIVNNIISLFTIIPLALVIIRISCIIYPIFSNRLFKLLGILSYEIYLIQYFSRALVTPKPISLYLCFIVTLILSGLFYVLYNRLRRYLLKS